MIDSGSTDATLEIAQRFPVTLRRIPPAEFGHGRTRNLGASLAQSEYIVYLTQDAIPLSPDWLVRLVAHFAHENVAGVYGRQIPRDDTPPMERYLLGRLYSDQAAVRKIDGSSPIRLEEAFFSNVNSAIRRRVWERIPFDETVIMSEDQLWAKQVLMAGHRIVYDPAAAVRHSHTYTLGALFRRYFDSGVSLLGVADDSLPQIMRAYVRHFAGEAAYISKNDPTWLPRMVLYEATRAFAFALGRQHDILPRKMKGRLSQHSYYWSTRE